ncbi:hypothetical protein JCM8547_001435 [Rhodosporidiobolus lusitaniae]
MTRYFCHECQAEGEWSSPTCLDCGSAFVEEIPPNDAAGADDPRNFDPDDGEDGPNPFAFLQGLGGMGQGGGTGGGFVVGQAPGGGLFFQAGAGGPGAAAGGGGAGGGNAVPGLNPLTTAMLQAFGVLPPAQGFAAQQGGARGEEREGVGAGQGEQGEGDNGGRQQVPIQNLATFLGEAFANAATPHPADHPDNNPFAEGGHERGAEADAEAQNDNGGAGGAGRGPFGGLMNLLNALGLGGGGRGGMFGAPGQAGDYVFSEANFQQILTDLMEQARFLSLQSPSSLSRRLTFTFAEQAAGRAGPQPAPDDMIEKLPRVKITQELLDESTITTCLICQDAYALSETTIALPCKHLFHEDCLTPWLKNSGTCPTCRYALVPQPGQEGYAESQAAAAGQGQEGRRASNSSAPGGGAGTSGNAEASASTSTAARPPLPTRTSSLPAAVEGGSMLPGSWVFPEGEQLTEDEDEGEGMDVEEDRRGDRDEQDPRSAAARAAERRRREERGQPIIEDVD